MQSTEPANIRVFYDDLRAAVLARVPIGLAERASFLRAAKGVPFIRSLTMNKINLLEQELAEASGTKSATLRDAQHQAGLSTFEHTASMLPVLESWSVHQAADRRISRALKWTFIYLTILIATAAAGMLLFAFGVVPSIESLRMNMYMPQPELDPNQVQVFRWLPTIAYVWVGLLALLLVWLLSGGFYRASMVLGGRELKRARVVSVALRSCQRLVEHDVELESAIDTSCNLVAATERERLQIRQLAEGAQTAQELGKTSQLLQVESSRRFSDFKTRIPVRLTVFVGGLLTAMYCVLLFWPIIGLLHDLKITGFGE